MTAQPHYPTGTTRRIGNIPSGNRNLVTVMPSHNKKQRKVVPLASGALLCLFPYFVSNLYLFIGAAVVLFILPFVIRTQ